MSRFIVAVLLVLSACGSGSQAVEPTTTTTEPTTTTTERETTTTDPPPPPATHDLCADPTTPGCDTPPCAIPDAPGCGYVPPGGSAAQRTAQTVGEVCAFTKYVHGCYSRDDLIWDISRSLEAEDRRRETEEYLEEIEEEQDSDGVFP